MRNLPTVLMLLICCYLLSCSLTDKGSAQPLGLGMIFDALK